MTNAELIQHLQQFPPDAIVVYAAYSEYSILEAEEVSFQPGEWHESGDRYQYGYIERNGTVMRFDPKTWDKAEGEPKFLPVITFPGN